MSMMEMGLFWNKRDVKIAMIKLMEHETQSLLDSARPNLSV